MFENKVVNSIWETLNTQQHLKEDLLILSRYFTIFLSYRFLFYYLFSNSHAQSNITFIIYITYRTYGVRFLEDYFYYNSLKSISAVTNESLIPYKSTRNTEPLIL